MIGSAAASGRVEQPAQLDQRCHLDHRWADRYRGTPCGIRHPLGKGTPAAVSQLIEDLNPQRPGLQAKHANALPVQRMPSVTNGYMRQFPGIM